MDSIEKKNLELEERISEFLHINADDEKRHNALLNLKLVKCDFANSKIIFRFDVGGEWCLNPYGGIHGGVSCSIFDTSMGIGAVAIAGEYVTTTDLSVNFLKPMLGRHYDVVCEYTHVGNKIIRCNAKLINIDTGELSTMAMAGLLKLKELL